MNRFKLVALLFFSAFISLRTPLRAQGRGGDRPRPPVVQISGQVRFHNGQPGPQGIMVVLDSQRGGMAAQTQTDSQGKFLFSGVPQDLYTVRARHPGFAEMSETVDMRNIPIANIQFELVPLAPASATAGSVGVTVPLWGVVIPPSAMQEFEAGRKLLFDGKKPQESISHFQKAIRAFPNYSSAYAALGVAQMDLKNWKEAETALTKAVELDEKLTPAYLALGACRNEQGNFSAAEAPLKKALELNPDSSQGEYELGRVYWALKRVEEADPHARRALTLSPDFAPGHLLMGNILLRRRDAVGALKEFKEYLRLDPNGSFAAPTRELAGKIEKALASPP